MSRYDWNYRKFKRFLDEGRGQGRGKSYKPWLKIQDVASDGCSSRKKGWKSNRIHHLLSGNEKKLFYLYEWMDEVVDIREQFPLLDIKLTIQIAEELGIRHPKQNNTIYVPTTDFMITLKRGDELIDIARTVKPSEKLEQERTQEKFRIERLYYQIKGIDWKIVVPEEIPPILTSNIDSIYGDYRLIGYGSLNQDYLLNLTIVLKDRLREKNRKIPHITSSLDEEMGLNKGICLRLFHYLLTKKQVTFDIENVPLAQLTSTSMILDIRD